MSTAVDAPFYSPEHSAFLPSQAARLQQVLMDYNPYLSLVFIPPADRTAEDTHPFGILDSSPEHRPYLVRTISEREIEGDPAAILAWLFEGDLSKHRTVDVLARQRLREDAAKLMDLRRQEEEAAERQELAAALLTGGVDQKHYYRHNGETFRR